MNWTQLADSRNYIFGSTSAIITNISLIVGLGSGSTGKLPILGALFTIAVADNISDSLGVHMYQEAEGQATRFSFLATALNFSARLTISASFILIVLLCSIPWAGAIAVVWGLLLLCLLSYSIARRNHVPPLREISKHLLVAVLVIAASRLVGTWIARHF